MAMAALCALRSDRNKPSLDRNVHRSVDLIPIYLQASKVSIQPSIFIALLLLRYLKSASRQ